LITKQLSDIGLKIKEFSVMFLSEREFLELKNFQNDVSRTD
jgi:hypothetical protein